MTGPADAAEFAELDLDRTGRRGYPEAILCDSKTPEQVRAIATLIRQRPDVITIFTRADADRAAAVLAELPDARHDPEARFLVWPPAEPRTGGGQVLIVAAGTSDAPGAARGPADRAPI